MYLIPFELLFPEISHRETHSLTLSEWRELPAGEYALLESYCPDPDCDCQRVMLNIVSRSEQKQVATISYSFDRAAKDAGPYLDPLNAQSPSAKTLLMAVSKYLEDDSAYVLRLKAHYALIKAAAADPKHPAQAKLADWKVKVQNLFETDKRLTGLQKALRVISEQEPGFAALESGIGRTVGKQRQRHRARRDKKTGEV